MKIAEKISKNTNQELEAEISFMHMTEEVGEIAREFVNQKIRPEKFDKENMKEEVCDVILDSLVLAKLLDMDISKELNKKIEKLNKKNGLV